MPLKNHEKKINLLECKTFVCRKNVKIQLRILMTKKILSVVWLDLNINESTIFYQWIAIKSIVVFPVLLKQVTAKKLTHFIIFYVRIFKSKF
jgi:hypothetical protein